MWGREYWVGWWAEFPYFQLMEQLTYWGKKNFFESPCLEHEPAVGVGLLCLNVGCNLDHGQGT